MRTIGLIAIFWASGCGDDNGGATDGGRDLAMQLADGGSDQGAGVDQAAPMCSMTPQTGDGQACSPASCPGGQNCVSFNAQPFTCYYACSPGNPGQCSCDRVCATLMNADGGVVGGGCVPGLGAGEKCGQGIPKPCAQRMFCAGPSGGTAYCLHQCESSVDCPLQTTCAILMSGGVEVGKACQYVSAPAGIAAGGACAPGMGTPCITGHLCESGTCKPRCDGPGATCTAGACTKVTDTASGRTLGYVCK